MKKAKERYYRIEYYDRHWRFQTFEVKHHTEVDIERLIREYPRSVRISKCNERGNNYSRRRIYDPMVKY